MHEELKLFQSRTNLYPALEMVSDVVICTDGVLSIWYRRMRTDTGERLDEKGRRRETLVVTEGSHPESVQRENWTHTLPLRVLIILFLKSGN